MGVLEGLVDHKGWHSRCGWVWDTPLSTERILQTLVNRGLASKKTDPDTGRSVYQATPAGQSAVKRSQHDSDE